MTLTKEKLLTMIRKETGIERIRSNEILETFFEIMKSTLESGEDVMISSFGKFKVRDKNERRGRNPQNGESMRIIPRKVVTFRCAPNLRKFFKSQE